MSDDEWDKMKDRRIELTLKRLDAGLSTEEAEELSRLQEMAAMILITHPHNGATSATNHF